MSGYGQRGASSAVRYFGATRPERAFLPGDLVRFEPPAGAYSPRSEQAEWPATPPWSSRSGMIRSAPWPSATGRPSWSIAAI